MNADDIINLKACKSVDWSLLRGKTIYITGATGLIGSNIVSAISECCPGVSIIVQARNEASARKKFGVGVSYVISDISNPIEYSGKVGYIIHCANPTSSKFFIENPVETIKTAVNGTINALEFAKEKKVLGFVFLSTMEVYGHPEKGHRVTESECGSFDTAVVRNCYPLGKQTCESLCTAYASEYGVPAKVLRLTQTFGPGVSYNDGRVFAELARCAIEKKDIVLKTKGETERSYLYTADAVTAILTALLCGKAGEIYTAANEETYCSVYEMAHMVAESSGIGVNIEPGDTSRLGYADTLFMNLDTAKLRSLGWQPQVGLREAYSRMIEDMKRMKTATTEFQ